MQEQSSNLHFVSLRPYGISLTEEHHEQRRDDQAERITERISEIMGSPDPLTGLFSAKLAHKGLGHDALFDEAIEECKKVFNFTSVAVKSASMVAMQREQERRTRIREQARSAARRAGLEVEEDDGQSLIPRALTPAPVKQSDHPATMNELIQDQVEMGFERPIAVQVAQARFDGKFGEAGRYITKKEKRNAGTGTHGGTEGGTGEN